MPSPALEVAHLRLTYGSTLALDGVSLTADAGQITAILGPNGAGKTSLLEAAYGLRRVTAGTIRVLGRDHRRLERRHRAQIGVVLQDGGLPMGGRVLETLRDRAALYAQSRRPEDLLRELGLEHRARAVIRSLSGGEQRRLAMACALVGQPLLVFLDEPGAGMDPHGRAVMNTVLSNLRDRGVAIVLTSHQLDDVEQVADRVVILKSASVVASGTVDELTHAHRECVTFTGPLHLELDTLLMALPADCSAIEVSPGRYIVTGHQPHMDPLTLATVTAWCAQHDVVVRDLRVGRQTLNDVYLSLTADHSGSAA